MSLFSGIEEKIILAIKDKMTFETEMIDTKKKFAMVTITKFDGIEVYRHELDMNQVVEAVQKRIK